MEYDAENWISFHFYAVDERNDTVTHSTVTKIIIEVSNRRFVCFSIQILTMVSLQDYLWVSVVILLVSNKFT